MYGSDSFEVAYNKYMQSLEDDDRYYKSLFTAYQVVYKGVDVWKFEYLNDAENFMLQTIAEELVEGIINPDIYIEEILVDDDELREIKRKEPKINK